MFIKEAWFWRGFQSAIFYYISCAPCTKVLDQRKKKQTAARAKAEKIARKAAQAQVEDSGTQPEYDHPLPSSTNPFWEEEMKLGPGPPPKRRNNRHAGGGDQRGKERGSKEKARKTGGSLEVAQADAPTPAGKCEDSSNSSKGPSGSEAAVTPMREVPKIVNSDIMDADWNRRRYQREDELLWGLDDEDEPQDHTVLAGGTKNGDSQTSRTPNKNRGQGGYYFARNPAVNDLHPPVVSTAPTSRSETQWMLQPPPRAKIMEGKERENRSRSGTGSTQSSRASSKRAGLGRQLSHRAFETMLAQSSGFADGKGDHTQAATHLGVGGVGMSRSRGSSNQSIASGQRYDREASSHGHPSPNSLQPSRSSSQRKAAPPPITLDNDPSLLSPSPIRPGLQTIPSTSLVQPSSSKKSRRKGEKENIKVGPLNAPEMTMTASEEGTVAKISSSTTALQELVIPPTTNQINRSSSLDNRDKKKDQERVGSLVNAIPFPGAEKGWAIPAGPCHSSAGKEGETNDENEWLSENYRHRHRWSMDF